MKKGKTDSRISGSRMSLECVVPVVPRQTVTAIGLSKHKQKDDMSGKLFWKQPLRGVVESGVLKI